MTQGIWAHSRYEATAEYQSWLNRGIPKSEGKAVAESLRAAASKGEGKGKSFTKRARSDGPKGGKGTQHGHKGSPPPPPLAAPAPAPLEPTRWRFMPYDPTTTAPHHNVTYEPAPPSSRTQASHEPASSSSSSTVLYPPSSHWGSSNRHDYHCRLSLALSIGGGQLAVPTPLLEPPSVWLPRPPLSLM